MLEYNRKKTSNRVDALISLISFPFWIEKGGIGMEMIMAFIAYTALIVAIINLCFYIFFEASKKDK